MAITPFKVIQGHRFWYQSKAHIRFHLQKVLVYLVVVAFIQSGGHKTKYNGQPLLLNRFRKLANLAK